MSELKLSKPWLQSFTEPHRVIHHSGNPIMIKYTPEYDKEGNLQLKPSGEHDLYAEIQSYKDSTDLALILNRYFNGDPSVLSRVQGAYMDISSMPTNMHEAMTLMYNARRDFEQLPVDIKQKFDNDPNKFLATLGTPEWFNAMQVAQPVNSDPKEGVVENAE